MCVETVPPIVGMATAGSLTCKVAASLQGGGVVGGVKVFDIS